MRSSGSFVWGFGFLSVVLRRMGNKADDYKEKFGVSYITNLDKD